MGALGIGKRERERGRWIEYRDSLHLERNGAWNGSHSGVSGVARLCMLGALV